MRWSIIYARNMNSILHNSKNALRITYGTNGCVHNQLSVFCFFLAISSSVKIADALFLGSLQIYLHQYQLSVFCFFSLYLFFSGCLSVGANYLYYHFFSL